MKRLLAISALALIAAACSPKESRVVILECRNIDGEDAPTIEQIQKATAEDPDRIKKILTEKGYKEDFGEKYPHYPFLWIIDKKLGLDYEYSFFEEALVPYAEKPPSKSGDYDTSHESNKSRISEDKKFFFNEFKTWSKNILLGEYGYESFLAKINLETLKLEGTDNGEEPYIQQCIEHDIPDSIKINFPKSAYCKPLRI